MGGFASPLQFVSVASALVWPSAAGLAVVLWSRSRATARARRLAALQGELQSLYRTVQAKPVPPRLRMVVDALKEGEELAPGAPARSPKGSTTPAGS